MDIASSARRSNGLVPSADLGSSPARAAARRHLVLLQPRVYVAQTQPANALEHVTAIRMSVRGEYAFLGRTALWLYGLGDVPEVVEAGVPHRTRYRARPPARIRRVAPAVLRGRRTVSAACLVAVEMAVVQVAADQSPRATTVLLEQVLRARQTTMPRVRSRLRRGVAGSAAVRSALDELAGTSLDAAVRRLQSALEMRGVIGLQTEVRFTSASGASAYGDLVDEHGLTVVEVDGYLTHTERHRFRADRRRDRWLSAEHGYLTVRVDAAETVDDLDGLAEELAALLLGRRVRRAATG